MNNEHIFNFLIFYLIKELDHLKFRTSSLGNGRRFLAIYPRYFGKNEESIGSILFKEYGLKLSRYNSAMFRGIIFIPDDVDYMKIVGRRKELVALLNSYS